VIVSDEAYLAYSGATNLPQLAAHGNLVVLRTLSKIGLAGLRCGFAISSPAIAAVLDKVRSPYNLSSLDQRAARFMLEEARDWCAARAAEVVAERSRLARELAALPGLTAYPSGANLVMVNVGAGRGAAVWRALADRGVLVRDFDRPGPLAGCLRITVGTPAENGLLLESFRALHATWGA
jgi:histidinol-phosphate aminotransferase